MNITDILIIIFILISFVIGIRDGLLKKLFAIIGVILALVMATKYMKEGGHYVQDFFKMESETSFIISFAFIFVIVVVLTNFIYRWFGNENKGYHLWDRIAGGVVGIAEGAVVLSLVLILMNLFDVPSREEKKTSTFYESVSSVAPAMFDEFNKLFPNTKKFKEELYNAIERYKKLEASPEGQGKKK